MSRSLAVFVGLFLFISTVDAGQFNPTLNIGDKAPEWKELPGVDGKKHSLADLKDKQLVVVIFTCNSCPVATDYEDRIIAIAKKYGGEKGNVGCVAINVNKVPEDSLDKMRERAEAKAFPFDYLFDETQQIAKDFGATFTPEFFVLDRERRIVYMGGLDDNSNALQATTNYLDSAIAAALQGTAPAKAETVAIGCMIRYARDRTR